MPEIHPSSTVGPEVLLAEDVSIGPQCTLEGAVHIGNGTRLMGHNYLRGPLTIGESNLLYPFVCLGFEPQDLKFDPARPGAGLEIGDRNVLRENVTMHRATSDEVPTRIGDDNLFMVGSHAGHDVTIGNKCVLVNQALVAGHSRVDDQVSLGGSGGIAQHLHIGRLVFVGGAVGVTANVPPFMLVRRTSVIGGINVIGLRRSGMPRDEIDQVKWAFRVIFHENSARVETIERLRERADQWPAIRELTDFLETCPGAICQLEGRKARH